MAMQRIAKPEVKKIGVRDAERYLIKYNNYSGQRNQRAKVINHYANKIRNDEFYTPTLMLARRNYNGGEIVLMNGQHTLQSIIVSNKPAYVTIERWEVESPSDEAYLFGQFDNVGRRSQNDMVKAYSQSIGIDAPSYLCNAAVSAAAVKEGKDNLYATDKARILPRYENFVAFLKYIFEDSLPESTPKTAARHMKRKPVYYAMLCTWEKNRDEAKMFWIGVRDGEGLTRKMPQYHLRDYLMTNNYSWGAGASAVRSVTLHEMASRSITAWNRYRKGGEIKMLKYYPKSPIPKAI